MKTMTCNQLGGACDKAFHADTWEDMKNQSMSHPHEMKDAKDTDHLKAMKEMKNKINDPGEMQKWMEKKEAQFNALPQD